MVDDRRCARGDGRARAREGCAVVRERYPFACLESVRAWRKADGLGVAAGVVLEELVAHRENVLELTVSRRCGAD